MYLLVCVYVLSRNLELSDFYTRLFSKKNRRRRGINSWSACSRMHFTTIYIYIYGFWLNLRAEPTCRNFSFDQIFTTQFDSNTWTNEKRSENVANHIKVNKTKAFLLLLLSSSSSSCVCRKNYTQMQAIRDIVMCCSHICIVSALLPWNELTNDLQHDKREQNNNNKTNNYTKLQKGMDFCVNINKSTTTTAATISTQNQVTL